MSVTLTCPCGAVFVVRESVLVPGVYQRVCPYCNTTLRALVI